MKHGQQFQNLLPQYYRSMLRDFRKIAASFVFFHLSFALLILAEICLIALFFSFLSSRSSILAFALGGFLLTCFTYAVLLFYYQARKPEQFRHLKERFIVSCRQILPMPPGEAQHHLSLADALSKLAAYLQDFESSLYKIPLVFKPLTYPIQRLSASCHREDVFRMKQLLLYAAIDEHLKQVRLSPTDLEVHASLASHYIALSRLYKESLLIRSHQKTRPYFEEKFRTFANLAIEEFQILNHYAPNDPWIHEQLAEGYRNLEMPAEEIQEVELLAKLRPQDQDILFRLGSLYFQEGRNAKGLQIYETLNRSRYPKAEELIASYSTPRK